jgi:hypothetical protein
MDSSRDDVDALKKAWALVYISGAWSDFFPPAPVIYLQGDGEHLNSIG